MQTTSRVRNLYYEDIAIGNVVTTAAHEITMDDVLAFAQLTRDMHPLHTDADYCRHTTFGRPIAHGLHGLALMEGLKSQLDLYTDTSIASLGWDKVKFHAPVFPGDHVHVKVVFAHKRVSRNGHGIVVEDIALVNQNGTTVTSAEHVTMVKLRTLPPAVT